jgi:hypothetical protein
MDMQLVTEGPQSVSAWATTTITATCPTSEITGYEWAAISGGHSCDGWGVWIMESKPTTDWTGWMVKFDRDARDARSCSVFAVCVLRQDPT